MVNAFKAVVNDGEAHLTKSVSEAQPSRDPFAERDVKAVITEIKNKTADSEKTGNLVVKMQEIVSFDEFLKNAQQSVNTPYYIYIDMK